MRIVIKPLTFLERMLDELLRPLMFILSGTIYESPQETHRWNYSQIQLSELSFLSSNMMVCHAGITNASVRHLCGIPLCHIPIFGGWREYVVLRPQADYFTAWHVGWISEKSCGISRGVLGGPVRMLLGPDPVKFFGIDQFGDQIPIAIIGRAQIGGGGKFSTITLR